LKARGGGEINWFFSAIQRTVDGWQVEVVVHEDKAADFSDDKTVEEAAIFEDATEFVVTGANSIFIGFSSATTYPVGGLPGCGTNLPTPDGYTQLIYTVTGTGNTDSLDTSAVHVDVRKIADTPLVEQFPDFVLCDDVDFRPVPDVELWGFNPTGPV